MGLRELQLAGALTDGYRLGSCAQASSGVAATVLAVLCLHLGCVWATADLSKSFESCQAMVVAVFLSFIVTLDLGSRRLRISCMFFSP